MNCWIGRFTAVILTIIGGLVPANCLIAQPAASISFADHSPVLVPPAKLSFRIDQSDEPNFLPQPRVQKKDDEPTIQPIEPLTLTPIPLPYNTKDPHKSHLLLLTDVLASVEQHYPLLLASFQERGVADGQFLTSNGAFDLDVDGFIRYNQGSFDSQRYNVGFTQPLIHQGIDIYGGYRLGSGSYPSYYQDRLTAEGGEFRLGLNVPLLKDRDIDKRRAQLQTTLLERNRAEPVIFEQRLLFQRKAAIAYWNWIAAAKRFRIAQELLDIAEKRETFLLKRLKAGAESRIEIVDNRRLIVDRRTKLVSFQRGYEQASIDLSLFLRDKAGHPQRPDLYRRPPDFPEPISPDPSQLVKDIKLAISQRPELANWNLQRKQVEVQLNQTENQLLPSLDFVAFGAQDLGQSKKSLDRYRFEAGVLLNVPLQRRQAKGTIRTLKAKLSQIMARQQFAQDRIASEVQNVISALVRAYEMRQQAKQTVDLTLELEEAEVRKLKLGKSNILIVNLRELAHAEAQLQEVTAFVLFYQSLADYYAVLGTNTSPLKK